MAIKWTAAKANVDSEANGKWISESGVYWKRISFQRENAKYLPENILRNLFISLSRQWSRLTAAKRIFIVLRGNWNLLRLRSFSSFFFGDFSLNFRCNDDSVCLVRDLKEIWSKFNKLNTFSLFLWQNKSNNWSTKVSLLLYGFMLLFMLLLVEQ